MAVFQQDDGAAADIVVNNAVAWHDWTTVLEQDEADYDSQFRSSVLHNVLMAIGGPESASCDPRSAGRSSIEGSRASTVRDLA